MFCHSNLIKITNFKQKSSISNIEISSHWCYGICGVIVNIIPARTSGSSLITLINIDWIILTDLKGQLQ